MSFRNRLEMQRYLERQKKALRQAMYRGKFEYVSYGEPVIATPENIEFYRNKITVPEFKVH